MAAGLSSKQRTDLTYKFLKGIQRELSKANVATIYEKATRTRHASLVFFEGDGTLSSPHSNVDGGFNISVGCSNASNGESFGFSRIFIKYKGENKSYGLAETGGRFETGLARIKELFAVSPTIKAEKIGTRCECGAPYDTATGGYRCAKLGTDSLV